MPFWNWWGSSGNLRSRAVGKARRAQKRLAVEALESRVLLTAVANLTAYRPMTEFIKYAQYPVAESQETSATLGPGIRFNGDDDNANAVPDFSDATATVAENDLVRVDINASGGSF